MKKEKEKERKKVLSTTVIIYRNKEKTHPLADINKIGPFFIFSPGIFSLDHDAL